MTIFRSPSVQVAVLQTRITQGDREKNWQSVQRLLAQVRPHKPVLIVLPEAFATGVNFIILQQMAEPIPTGPTCQALGELARDLAAYFVAGVLERDSDGRIYDSAVVVSPKGAVAAVYRRRFLWIGERSYLAKGCQPVMLDTEFGRLGLLIGYDLCFPAACEGFLAADVDIGICPASVFTALNHNAARLPLARAMDHHCYFVYANAVGFHQFANLHYTGRSGVFAGPYFLQVQMLTPATDGLGCLSQASDSEEQVVLADLHPGELSKARQRCLPFRGDAAFSTHKTPSGSPP